MNTIAANTTTMQPLLPAAWRAAAAIAVAALMALALMSARQASHEAVQTAAATFSRSTVHVTLPSVEIVGRRQPTGGKTGRAGAPT